MTEIICHAYDIKFLDNYRNRGYSEIHFWCLNKESNPYLIRINDFKPFCYIELPILIGKNKAIWDNTNIEIFIKYLNACLGNDKILKYNLEYKSKIHYHRNKVYPMLYAEFNTYSALNHCKNFLAKPKTIENIGFCLKFNILEESINSIRKIMTRKNCRFSQWFKINGTLIDFENEDRASIFGNINRPIQEYIGDINSILPIPSEECRSWTTNPMVLAFDIETYSPNHRALPDKLNPKHCAYLISCIYQKYKDKSTRKRYVIIKGDCNEIPNCEKIIKVKSEIELINEMSNLVLELDPEIITGYNIFSYDYPYLHARLTCNLKLWKQMGRLQGVLPEMTSISWESSSYGNNDINILEMEGRISIDMLPIIKRDYKLDKYDLNSVSKKFLKSSKHDITAIQMFEIYEKLLKNPDSFEAINEMTKVTAYCVQDSELVLDLIDKLNIWIGLIELSNIVGVTITDIFTRGQQIRCLSQIYDLSTNLNVIIDKRDAPKYFFQGAFVFEPKPGLYENIICLDFASLYPSIMEAYNICYSTLIPPELENSVSDDDCNIIEFSQDEPISGKKEDSDSESDDDIDVKKKKIPEILVKKHYKFKFVKKEIKMGILPQLVHNLVNERNQVRKQIKIIKKAEIKIINDCLLYLKSLIPNTDINNLIVEIENCDDNDKINLFNKIYLFIISLKNYDNSFFNILELKILVDNYDIENIVLDKRQLALKVSANSMYGFLGVQNGGKLPLIEGAMSVTAMGRKLITEVNTFLETEYGAEVVYNDTDSSMVDLHITDRKECDKFGNMLAERISGTPDKLDENGILIKGIKGLFPPPLRMEFEKAMRFFSLKKKKYLALLINKDGSFEKDSNGEYYILKKGVSIARRDINIFTREIYTEVSKKILLLDNMDSIYNILTSNISKILRGEINEDKLFITRELGSNYKNNNFYMKLFSSELAKMGNPMAPGNRISYVLVTTEKEKTEKKVLAGYKMREIEMFKISQNYNGPPNQYIYPKENLDYLHYIEKTLMKPLDQLFNIAFNKELVKCVNIGYKSKSKCKFVNILNPIKMIFAFIKDQLKIISINEPLLTDNEKFLLISNKIDEFPDWFKLERLKLNNDI